MPGKFLPIEDVILSFLHKMLFFCGGGGPVAVVILSRFQAVCCRLLPTFSRQHLRKQVENVTKLSICKI